MRPQDLQGTFAFCQAELVEKHVAIIKAQTIHDSIELDWPVPFPGAQEARLLRGGMKRRWSSCQCLQFNFLLPARHRALESLAFP